MVLAAAVWVAGSTAAVAADGWQLSQTSGDKAKGWAAEPNWTWDDGNPMTDNGATWRLATQPDADAKLNAPYKDMVHGLYVNYYRIWQGHGQSGKDPANQYRGQALYARNSSHEPGVGAGSVIMFRPPAADKYQVHLAGGVSVQNKTAGYVRVTIYTLSDDLTNAERLDLVNLNVAGGYKSAKLADQFDFNQTVALEPGQWLAIRVQAVNPGPAPAGTVSIHFNQAKGGAFEIKSAP